MEGIQGTTYPTLHLPFDRNTQDQADRQDNCDDWSACHLPHPGPVTCIPPVTPITHHMHCNPALLLPLVLFQPSRRLWTARLSCVVVLLKTEGWTGPLVCTVYSRTPGMEATVRPARLLGHAGIGLTLNTMQAINGEDRRKLSFFIVPPKLKKTRKNRPIFQVEKKTVNHSSLQSKSRHQSIHVIFQCHVPESSLF